MSTDAALFPARVPNLSAKGRPALEKFFAKNAQAAYRWR
jgi:hypothetical protein